MANDSWIHPVTWIYLGCNATRLFAYVPQVRDLLRRDRSEPVSVSTWVVPALANASTVAFALTVHGNVLLVWTATANLVASLLLTGLAMKRERTSPPEPHPSLFHLAEYIRDDTSSGRDGVVDAPIACQVVEPLLLDAVTGDECDAVRPQFGSFDPAPGIGIRAAWMKGAA